MTPTRHEWLRALDDLEHVRFVLENDVADGEAYEEAVRMLRRVLAVLHAVERNVRWSDE